MGSEEEAAPWIVQRLAELLKSSPGKIIFTRTDSNGRDLKHLTVQELVVAAVSLKSALLSRSDVSTGDRVILCFGPGLHFTIAFAACLAAGLIPVPISPPNPYLLAAELPNLEKVVKASGAKAILSNREYSLARLSSRLSAKRLMDTMTSMLSDKRVEQWPAIPFLLIEELRGPTVPIEVLADRLLEGPWPGDSGLHDTFSKPISPATPANAEDGNFTDTRLAYLQFTSGSTGMPKGVAITHGNLCGHSVHVCFKALGVTQDSVTAVWLPHFHDYMLAGVITPTLATGCHAYIMSPLDFVAQPSVWLALASRIKATHLCAPDFAYALTLRKTTPEQREAWDLSHVQIAMSAAESVRATTVTGFLAAFQASKLAPTAFCPAYGLAEHVVGVSIGGNSMLSVDRKQLEQHGLAKPLSPAVPIADVDGCLALMAAANDANGAVLVGCGKAAPGVTLRVVNHETHEACAEGAVGEIWSHSTYKASGYFGLQDVSQETFYARMANDKTNTPYLRTGDLGFLHEGQLFMTGRSKDLIISCGRNLYPADLEESIRGLGPPVRPGGIACFSMNQAPAGLDAEEGQEGIVVVVEVTSEISSHKEKQKLKELATAIRRALAQQHQVAVYGLVITKPATIPRTTSGKLRRGSAREQFLNGGPLSHVGGPVLYVSINGKEADSPGGSSVSLVDMGEDAPTANPAAITAAAASASTATTMWSLPLPFRRGMIDRMGPMFAGLTRGKKGRRVFHTTATTALGTFKVLNAAADMACPLFFEPGREWTVLLRHANGVQEDDAGGDNRGATLRLLAPESASSGNYESSELDLLLTTGQNFVAHSAADFLAWMSATPAGRAEIVRKEPHRGQNSWDMMRRIESYSQAHYYSKTASSWQAEDGSSWYARFRLTPPHAPPDTGFLVPDGRALPPETGLPRQAGDTRAKTFLHDQLRTAIMDTGVEYLLQVQLYQLSAAAAPACPMAGASGYGAAASTVHASEEARNNVGSARKPVPGQRVCVIGAGPAGLTAARELKALGYQVTVLERESEVAGKCASITVDGHIFDLGGHICTRHYKTVAEMVKEVGLARAPVTDSFRYDLPTRAVVDLAGDPKILEALMLYKARYQREVAGAVGQPGHLQVPESMRVSAQDWLAKRGLAAMGRAVGPFFTGCGYGFMSDDQLPAASFLKSIHMADLLETGPGHERWAVEGGFGELWRRVAASLPDVRTNCQVNSIERGQGGISLATSHGTITCDKLVVAIPEPTQITKLLPSVDKGAVEDMVGQLRTWPYYTIVATVSGPLPRMGFYMLDQFCNDPSTLGHVVAYHHRYEDSNVMLFYNYASDDQTAAEVEALTRQDVEAMGGKVEEVHLIRKWTYSPHAGVTAQQAGYHPLLARLQEEQDGVFYVGSYLDFELVECTAAVTRATIRRLFGGSAEQLDFGITNMSLLYEYPTIQDLAGYLAEGLAANMPAAASAPVKPTPVVHKANAPIPIPIQIKKPATVTAQAQVATPLGPVVKQTALYTHIKEVVIGECDGLRLVADVFLPVEAPNGRVVVDVVSASFKSGREQLDGHMLWGTFDALTRRGFAVVAVFPGSGPTIPAAQIVANIRAAIAWIQKLPVAAALGVNSVAPIGLLGFSAGGLLALHALLATEEHPQGKLAGAQQRLPAGVGALVLMCPYLPTLEQIEDGTCPTPAAFSSAHNQILYLSPFQHLQRTDALGAVPSTLILHAERDAVAPYGGSILLKDHMAKEGHSAQLVIRDSDQHMWPFIGQISQQAITNRDAQLFLTFSDKVIPPHECARLLSMLAALEGAGDMLEPQHRRMCEAYARAIKSGMFGPHVPTEVYERWFDNDMDALTTCEYFSEEALASAAALRHIERAHIMPGMQLASAARLWEVTRHPKVEAAIRKALDQGFDYLNPGQRSAEVAFVFSYLVKAGVLGLKDHCRVQTDYLTWLMTQRPKGVGLFSDSRNADADITGMSLFFCHSCGVEAPYKVQVIEDLWVEKLGFYQASYENTGAEHSSARPSPSIMCHVWDATMIAPEASYDEKLVVWKRLLALMESAVWEEVGHMSPFFMWELIAYSLGQGLKHGFPGNGTRVHHRVVAEVLTRQRPGGGFASGWMAGREPCAEETALALLTLNHALGWYDLPTDMRERCTVAADRAAAWLLENVLSMDLDTVGHTDFWNATLVCACTRPVEAIILAALYAHVRRCG
ncbi:hypothetical protein WJX72_011699 [[Myrmecia] bisecta]|uniref:protein-S-isoprenylcysteine alpha-carbonyl methylesterase n=1 Tax=[Myrmecia] bisecta TaxID=41462 RepID=A0AAW1R9T0_9CHLO